MTLDEELAEVKAKIAAVEFLLSSEKVGDPNNPKIDIYRKCSHEQLYAQLEKLQDEKILLLQQQSVLSTAVDTRYKLFNPDVSTNVFSTKALKDAVRDAYNNCCLLCGTRNNLSVAHLIANNSGISYDAFGPPTYKDDLDRNSIRNRILLCGTKGEAGTCHDYFDKHAVSMFHNALDTKYKWFCFKEVIIGGMRKYVVGEIWDVNFPSTLHESDHPYRRLIAWRFRNSATNYANSTATVTWVMNIADLSEEEEKTRHEQDHEQEYGHTGKRKASTSSTSTAIDSALSATRKFKK